MACFVFCPVVVRAADAGVKKEVNIADRARALLLVEAEHGSVVLAKSPGLALPIASLTKLMTALVFVEQHPTWDRIVQIQKEDVQTEGRAVLHAGDRIRLRDLFTLALVRSDNTAAQSLTTASGLPLDVFIAAMNERAAALGLLETTFVEPTGLRPENRSTARDLVHLAATAFADPTIGAALKKSSATIRFIPAKETKERWVTRKIYSTNTLLGKREKNFQILSGKTGTTDEAGYSYIVNAQTFTKPKRSLLVVILSAGSARDRFDLALDLFSFGMTRLSSLESPQIPTMTVHSAMAN